MRTRLAVPALVAIVPIALAACAGGPRAGESSPTDVGASGAACGGTVAVMAPITGAAALAGREQVSFATLAVDDFNAERGSAYRIAEVDTQLDAGQASTQAQSIVTDPDVIAVLGPSSSQEAAAVGPVFASADLAYVSGSASNPSLTDGRNPTFFRVVPTDDIQAPTVATFMAGELGSRVVTIIEERTDFGTGLSVRLEQALEQAGIAVTRLPVSKDKRSYDDVVSRIPRGSDTVFLAFQVAAKAQQFGQSLIKAGRDVRLVASEGSYTPEFSIAGAHVTSLTPDIRGVGDAAGVVERFTARFGEFSGLGAPTYVSAQVVLEAAQRACEAAGRPAERGEVLAEVPATALRDTILGRDIGFDERGDVSGAGYSIFRVEQDGSFTLVGP